jgi:hypothetical protein
MDNSNSTVHDDSVRKRRVAGKLVFKFQNPSGFLAQPTQPPENFVQEVTRYIGPI